MEQEILSVYDFGKLTKDEMRSRFAMMGINGNSITTKVTKSRLISLYRLVLGLRGALDKLPPQSGMDARDAIYRRNVTAEAGHDMHQWSVLSYAGVKYSSIFIHLVHAKMDEIEKARESLDPVGPNDIASKDRIDASEVTAIRPLLDGPDVATAVKDAIARELKEPEDRLTEVFKYLGDLARNSGADITINFKSTI